MLPSAVACRLTIHGMFQRSARRDVNGPYWYTPKSCYLHTLTFANPEPSYEEARKRWNSFASNYLNKGGRFGVCVPQWGEKTGRLHFHLVSSERWDASEMHVALQRYGFGRYDVRERPVEVAAYAARYVGKRNGRPLEVKGARLWSAFGAKHFPNGVSKTGDCKMVTKCLTIVADSPQPFSDRLTVTIHTQNETVGFTHNLRADGTESGYTRMNEITAKQFAVAASEIAKGGFVGIGEYRSCIASTKEMSDFKDKNKKVSWVFVDHRIEFGGVQFTIEERLSQGSVESAVVAPAKSGESIGFVAKSQGKEFNGVRKWKGKLFRLDGVASGLPPVVKLEGAK